jgi:hypothetical protein
MRQNAAWDVAQRASRDIDSLIARTGDFRQTAGQLHHAMTLLIAGMPTNTPAWVKAYVVGCYETRRSDMVHRQTFFALRHPVTGQVHTDRGSWGCPAIHYGKHDSDSALNLKHWPSGRYWKPREEDSQGEFKPYHRCGDVESLCPMQTLIHGDVAKWLADRPTSMPAIPD